MNKITKPQSSDLVLHLNLINGLSVGALDGRTLPCICPSDGEAYAAIPRSGAPDIDLAVQAARAAFETGPWGRMTATERGRVLVRLGELVLSHHEELALLEAIDTGKPMKQARADMTATARYFEFYGTSADKLHGETIPFLNGYTVAVVRDPHGVTGHIVPWNYPAQIFGRSVGASLACGNTCVVKPAEDACLSLIRICQLTLDAGLPPGALNIVTGLGSEAGAALANHPGINFISFTGSPETGSVIQQAAARNHIGCTLELGGKSPQILFEDADLERALPVLINAIIQNGGQTCSAGSRILVQRGLYDTLVPALVARFNQIGIGSHHDDRDMGAMINLKQKQRVEMFTARAKAEGVPVLATATLPADLAAGGFYTAPTLFGPVPRDNMLAREEVFGPVLSVIPFEDEADAIALANGTPYGLVAGIWSNDARRSMRVARAMRCGQVFVNGYGAGGGIELPFGGVGKSGHGREKGFEALYEFSASKTIVINHG
ncbi:MAG: aldehyde dehydrogenase family protein [Beijerinckiaceae bacterium]